MSPALRLLRVALAAATLHLTMAPSASACDQTERATAPATHQMSHQMSHPMSHAGHHMPTPESPAPAHGQHHPCCPTMPAGCAGMACTTLAMGTIAFHMAPLSVAATTPSMADVERWQSVLNPPEPPPPRS